MPTRYAKAIILMLLTACTPSQEASRVELDVTLDDAKLEASTNDLGWTVELTEARIAVSDVQFTILGETHGAIAWIPSWIIGRAWAHPGHYAGGDVTGEMTGDFILDWIGHPGMKLGTAEMLTGVYHGMNFTFRTTGADDKLTADDPLLGHTAHFVGTAHKDDLAIAFTAQVDIDANAQLIGAPFDLEVTEDHQAMLAVQFFPQDHVDDDSLFDGLDFGVLDDDNDGKVSITPGDTAHNIFRRTVQSHVHYNVTTK